MLFDNPEYGCQAEPRAFAGFFGGKKRLKNAWNNLRWNTATSIGDAQTRVLPERSVGNRTGLCFVEILFGRLDKKPDALGHGITRVDYEIEEHLIDHSSIRANHERTRVQVELQKHIFTQDAL